MIKISVREVTSKGLDIERTIPKEGIGLSTEEVDIRSPLNVMAHLDKVDDAVIADTRVQADFVYACARCLEEFHCVEERSYIFDFQLDPTVEYIDLGEEIRQEILMANPSRILCKPDCKGICLKCGANLNLEQCQCK